MAEEMLAKMPVPKEVGVCICGNSHYRFLLLIDLVIYHSLESVGSSSEGQQKGAPPSGTGTASANSLKKNKKRKNRPRGKNQSEGNNNAQPHSASDDEEAAAGDSQVEQGTGEPGKQTQPSPTAGDVTKPKEAVDDNQLPGKQDGQGAVNGMANKLNGDQHQKPQPSSKVMPASAKTKSTQALH